MFLVYCSLFTYHVFTAKFYFYIFIGRRLLLPSPLAPHYLNQMPRPINLTTIPPGENGLSYIPRDWMGWGERPTSLFDLAQGKDKASFPKLGSSLCRAKGEDQGCGSVVWQGPRTGSFPTLIGQWWPRFWTKGWKRSLPVPCIFMHASILLWGDLGQYEQ